jgi:hypothetical protein
MARRMQWEASAMDAANELADLDEAWDRIATDAPEEPPPESGVTHAKPPDSKGAFGHATERRLGLRVPAALWVLVKDGDRGLYARTVEISPTGAVLKLLDGNETRFDRARKFELDIFVPGSVRPLHAVAWPARSVGQLQAFEFVTMSSSDRLTLAEHLDYLAGNKPNGEPSLAAPQATAPPVSWRRFVLSLRRANASFGPSAQRF